MGVISDYTITLNKTRLTTGVTNLYIEGNEDLFDSQYSRRWVFKTNEKLPITYNGSPEKVCFYIKDANESNYKIILRGLVGGNTQDISFQVIGEYYQGNQDFSGAYNYNDNSYGKNYTYNVGSYSTYTVNVSNYTTNVPVFETVADADDYLNGTLSIESALNYYSSVPDGKDFNISNPWTHGTWTEYGVQSPGVTAFRNVRGKIVSGNFALYPIEYSRGDTDLKYAIKTNAEFYGLEYSTDGTAWTPAEEFPFNFFYRPRVDEIGTFNYGLTCSTEWIPAFEDEATAEGYIDGAVPITEATNWPTISPFYPDIDNPTGDPSAATVFGEVFSRGFFSQQYILNEAALEDIATNLFDTNSGGVWEHIKKGLDMFGDSPIEAVMGLSFWPINLTSVFTSSSPQSYIYFGGYKLDLSQGSCNKIIYPNGYKTIATVPISRRLNNWMDFEPYTKLYVMLPYCGTYQLDLARYYGKTLEIRYYFDTRVNSCICCLIADNQLIDYFNGQVGCTMPITLTDYSGFANAQINTLLGGGGQAVSTFGNAAAQTGAAASSVAAAGSVLGGVALSGAVTGAKTVYGLSQNNINNFNKTKGGSTSMINQFLPQRACLIWEYQVSCEPSNYYEMFGAPSMYSGRVSNFSGFLKCQSVKVNCPKATESEKEKIKSMLLSGIYI